MGSNQTLGMRNNNPLNIRYAARNKWKGQTGENKGFCVFESIVHGYRAAFINLRTYHNRGLNTIEKIITTWAPPTENKTESYVQYMVDRTGYERKQVLKYDYATYSRIVSAMSVMESAYQPTDVELRAAWQII